MKSATCNDSFCEVSLHVWTRPVWLDLCRLLIGISCWIGSDTLATDLNPVIKGHWSPGPNSVLGIKSIALSGPYAFLAAYQAGLQILDVTDPARPQRVGQYGPGSIWETGDSVTALAVAGKYAFLSTFWGLLVIDVSDPRKPRRVGGTVDQRGSYANAMAVVGAYVYMGGSYGLHAFNISDPANPRWVWEDTTGYYYKMAVSGTRLILARSTGLEILDLTTPDSPQRLGNFSTAYPGTLALSAEGTYVYVVTGELTANDQSSVVAVEIIEPTSLVKLQRVATIKTPSLPWAAAVGGDRLFLGIVSEGANLRIYDLTDPTRPPQVGAYNSSNPNSYPTAVAVAGKSCYFASGRLGPDAIPMGAFFDVLDVSDSANPRRRGSFHDAAGWPQDVALSGSYAYVADSMAGLQIFDISNPARPALVGRVDTGRNTWAVALTGSLACLADRGRLDGAAIIEAGLRVVDISNPAQPVMVGRYDTEGPAIDVATADSHAYLLDARAGLLVIDLSDPAHPQRVGSYPAGLGAVIAIAGNLAYICGSGLQIIDISDPDKPARVGSVDGAIDATSVAISGRYALLSDPLRGMIVIDVSSPAKPVQVGSRSLGVGSGDEMSVAVSGNFAVVSNYDALDFIDLTDPTRPHPIGHLADPSLFVTSAVALSGNHAFVTSMQLGGLRVIEFIPPANPQRLSGIDVSPTGVRFRFTGIPSRGYSIERAPVVTGPWNTINTQTAPASGLLEYIDANPPVGAAFYRTREP